eukprot:4123586-Prymnesium_polylepis.1
MRLLIVVVAGTAPGIVGVILLVLVIDFSALRLSLSSAAADSSSLLVLFVRETGAIRTSAIRTIAARTSAASTSVCGDCARVFFSLLFSESRGSRVTFQSMWEQSLFDALAAERDM